MKTIALISGSDQTITPIRPMRDSRSRAPANTITLSMSRTAAMFWFNRATSDAEC